MKTADPPTSVVYCCHGCRFAAGMTSPTEDSGTLLGPANALGLSVFFTMNVVMLTMALWSYTGDSPSQFERALREFLRYGSLVFSLPVLLFLGRPLISHAINGLRVGIFTSDLLLATGVVAAYTLSIINTIRGSGHVYFEVGCVILVLVTLGRWMEAEGRSRASHALDKLERLVPQTVRLATPKGDIQLPRSQVVLGSVIRVLAGDRIPLDGRLVRGRGVVDEQFFTGESAPAEKKPGDGVFAGSLNLDGDLMLEVTALAEGGALGRLVDAVRAARASKGGYQRLSDLWSQWFFPIVSAIAVAAFFYHGVRTDWEHGLLTLLSVVLIACPCALALATPLAVWTALGTAASKGVLCRSGAALEKLAAIRALRWDKTGTLTTGSPKVEHFVCEDDRERQALLQLALTLTCASKHLYSQAINDYGLDFADSPDDSATGSKAGFDVKTFAGRGLLATRPDGKSVVLGSLRWMEDNGLRCGPRLSGLLNDSVTSDKPVVAIGFDDQVNGLFILEETIRSESGEVIARLQDLGLNQAILTGDRAVRARTLAKALCLEVHAELLPEQKLEEIRSAHAEYGCVAMIGDGLNDAPALAAADVGIALGCGADVSRDSADICLLSSNLELIPWSYQFARKTVSTIRTNLIWSFGYNSVGVIFAAAGQLHPALSAALMVVSSVVVLCNSLKLSFESDAQRVPAEQSLNSDLVQSASVAGSNSAEVTS